MKLDGNLKGDAVGLSMGLCQLLPGKDPSGRSILFMDSSRQDRKLVDTKHQARASAYMLMAALENEITQQKGIVVLFWPAKERWDQPNREFITLMGASIKGALPGTYRNICFNGVVAFMHALLFHGFKSARQIL